MTLIKSISGIRGTIGGAPGKNLTPIDVCKFSAAYGAMLKKSKNEPTVVIGRDARLSGEMVAGLVSNTLVGMGIKVLDAGLSTTPTIEMAVINHQLNGGIIITASHNPMQWNALKLLDNKGEFLNADKASEILKLVEEEDFEFSEVKKLGGIEKIDGLIEEHIKDILALPLVNKKAISEYGFRIAIDCVNSSGGLAVPALLKALGVEEVHELYTDPTGHFPHNPEPLPEHLSDLSQEVNKNNCHLGIVVDPDVDRLAFMCEDGSYFGEEYTLVSVAQYILSKKPGNTVSNLSSTRALMDITEKAGGDYTPSAVGEVNVVQKMKEVNAVIGGEGNGGVILPDLHYGRDALVGIALFLSHVAEQKISVSRLRAQLPNYFISKNKIELTPSVEVDEVLEAIKEKYKREKINTADGVRIDFEQEWVHLRKSNTEPIIRIYAESASESTADHLARKIMQDIKELV